MLETIRELARERFDASGEAEAIGQRHAEWFLAVAERAEPFLKGAEQPAWLQRLEDDHDNLRQSLDWLLAHDETELAGRLAAALWLFWYMHGHVGEARRWLQRALEAGSDEPSETRAKLLDGAGYLAFEQSDDEAVGLLEASLSCAKEVGATSTAAFAAAHLGGVLAWAGSGGSDVQAALAVGDEAVRLARQAGDDYVLAVALNNLGATHDCSGTRSEQPRTSRRALSCAGASATCPASPCRCTTSQTVRSVRVMPVARRPSTPRQPRSQAQSATSGTSASHTEGSPWSHTANGAGKTRRRTRARACASRKRSATREP